MELGFNLQLYETSRCTSPGHPDLVVELARSTLGVWHVEVREVGGRAIETSFPTEVEARRSVELAYSYGRQFGQWHIQRRQGYLPDPENGAFSSEGREADPRRAEA